MAKLPIWGTIHESFGFCFSNIGSLLKIALIPMVLATVLNVLLLAMGGGGDIQTSSSPILIFGALGINILSIFVTIPFVTAWHRQYLDNHDSARIGFTFGGNEWRYFLNTILVSLISVLVLLPFLGIAGLFHFILQLPAIAFVFIAVGVIASVVVTLRLTMVFPAAAIGASAGLKDSWRATKGHAFRIWLVQFVLILIMFGILFGLIAILAAITIALVSSMPENATILTTGLSILSLPIEMILTGITVSCLSVIYRFLSLQDDVTNSYTMAQGDA